MLKDMTRRGIAASALLAARIQRLSILLLGNILNVTIRYYAERR